MAAGEPEYTGKEARAGYYRRPDWFINLCALYSVKLVEINLHCAKCGDNLGGLLSGPASDAPPVIPGGRAGEARGGWSAEQYVDYFERSLAEHKCWNWPPRSDFK